MASQALVCLRLPILAQVGHWREAEQEIMDRLGRTQRVARQSHGQRINFPRLLHFGVQHLCDHVPAS